MKRLRLWIVTILMILIPTICNAQLNQYFDFHLLTEAPEEKIVIKLSGNWNAVSNFYQVAVAECINTRDFCLERENIYTDKIKYLESELSKPQDINILEMLTSKEFALGFTVGIGIVGIVCLVKDRL